MSTNLEKLLSGELVTNQKTDDVEEMKEIEYMEITEEAKKSSNVLMSLEA
ncbi:MAG: hypothetical protein LBM95_08210 [Lactobacillales bacterium]|nr:hypothetical protein [Lactobacillales bacterium]